ALVFAILLVSGNTMAMSIRERVREVALLETLGFTRGTILGLFVGEAVMLSLLGGLLGVLFAAGVVQVLTRSPMGVGLTQGMHVTIPTQVVALMIAALVGFVSAFVPAYHASRVNIVEGLRHVGCGETVDADSYQLQHPQP